MSVSHVALLVVLSTVYRIGVAAAPAATEHGAVAGRVVEEDGGPVPFAAVRLTTDSIHLVVLADGHGQFAIDPVPAGQARARAWHEDRYTNDTAVTVPADATAEVIIVLDEERPLTSSGCGGATSAAAAELDLSGLDGRLAACLGAVPSVDDDACKRRLLAALCDPQLAREHAVAVRDRLVALGARPEAFARLLATLAGADPAAASRAVEMLAGLAEAGLEDAEVRALAGVLEREQVRVRGHVVGILSADDSPAAHAALLPALHDASPLVRHLAVEAMDDSELSPLAGAHDLLAMAHEISQAGARVDARLGEPCNSYSVDDCELDLLVDETAASDTALRLLAMLGGTWRDHAHGILVGLASAGDERLRLAAVRVLSSVTDEWPEGAREIGAMLADDPDAYVRAHAHALLPMPGTDGDEAGDDGEASGDE